MSESGVVDAQPVITGVAPVVNTPKTPKRVIGGDAEAGLRERFLAARNEEVFYQFRGREYRLITPMPASFMIHAGQIQNGDDVDMREFVSAIRSAFVGADGQAFVDALLDNDADIPADAEYVSDVLSSIVEAVSNRPPTN